MVFEIGKFAHRFPRSRSLDTESRPFKQDRHRNARPYISVFACLCVLLISSCAQLEKPAVEPYFAKTAPPAKQEFRWSNGKAPSSLDPVKAAAAPETDIVRAIFEGLTATDPVTLQEVPGVAQKWSANEDFRVWTFELRKDAKWSNGKPVTANDFVRSWRRLGEMGDAAANAKLLTNIVGFPVKQPQKSETSKDEGGPLLNSMSLKQQEPPPLNRSTVSSTVPSSEVPGNASSDIKEAEKHSKAKKAEQEFGISAESDLVLTVRLDRPDQDFAKLVANPIFRPIYGDGSEFDGKSSSAIVTNGPFRIKETGDNGILLERSDVYWDKDAVKLDFVRFVPMQSPESALEAYRAGQLDAVTNAEYQPLALKLLSPYDDFKRTTHAALNYYEVNTANAPFSDRRVRQALSNAIERERLTDGEMEGLTRPALSLMPFGTRTRVTLTQDKEKARELLDEAGFPDGENFPVIRLLVNRNDTQQRVARSVARMWKQNLNLDTEIIVKESGEIEAERKAGNYDLVRRGEVIPTTDELAVLMSIFDVRDPVDALSPESKQASSTSKEPRPMVTPASSENANSNAARSAEPSPTAAVKPELTEDAALYELSVIPLYFPTSYSLVKPYVSGFAINSLDIQSLSDVVIDNNWQPDKAGRES